MKKIILILFLTTIIYASYGQKEIRAEDKIVFVYYENEPNNLIVIPNIGKLHTFKIYRKLREENEYKLVVTKKKPLLPMRYNVTPYSVSWEDTGFHSREIDYKIIALNKKGVELCEMKVIWQDKK